MKRSRLESRRVRVVLPASRQPLPRNATRLLQDAFMSGRTEAIRFSGAKDLRQEPFVKILGDLDARAEGHPGLRHLSRALFFYGLHLEIEDLARAQELVSQPTQRNIVVAGTTAHLELIRTQLHLTQVDSAWLFHLRLPGPLGEWWARRCGGAIAVAQLIHFLLANGFNVYLPTTEESIRCRFNLIATRPGQSPSICFQVKANPQVEWVHQKVWKTAPNGHASDTAHHFVEGVRCFQERTHGLYVPVELIFGSQHFEDGAIEAKEYVADALQSVLKEALT